MSVDRNTRRCLLIYLLICFSIDLHRSLLAQFCVDLEPVSSSSADPSSPQLPPCQQTSVAMTTLQQQQPPQMTSHIMTSQSGAAWSFADPASMAGIPMTSLSPLTALGLPGFPPTHFDPGAMALVGSPPNQQLQQQQQVPMFAFDSLTNSFVDLRSNLAPKIKGSFSLASFAKNSNKFSPY